MSRGYFGIGIFNAKIETNLGTLWRSAQSLGANFMFTIGRRYQPQCSDTTKVWRHLPLFYFPSFDDLILPYEAQLVGIEIVEGATPLPQFFHPERAVYLLGAEDDGLPESITERCQHIVTIPGAYCLNVAVAGSIVLYDRVAKNGKY